MCAVLGAVIIKPSDLDFDLLKTLFEESSVRGLHATGVSFVRNSRVETIKLPVPARQFPFEFQNYLNEDGNLYLIGHCRYSTSDLEYNQPIANEQKSIVHNGVITQEDSSLWKELYGVDCTTKNDSELVLLFDDALQRFNSMSMGVCELSADKTLKFYRNHKRPLYYIEYETGVLVASTRNILKRTGFEYATRTNQNTVYSFKNNLLTQTTYQSKETDIQP